MRAAVTVFTNRMCPTPAANDLVHAFKAAAQDTGKTWVFHIILFILSRQIRRYAGQTDAQISRSDLLLACACLYC